MKLVVIVFVGLCGKLFNITGHTLILVYYQTCGLFTSSEPQRGRYPQVKEKYGVANLPRKGQSTKKTCLSFSRNGAAHPSVLVD